MKRIAVLAAGLCLSMGSAAVAQTPEELMQQATDAGYCAESGVKTAELVSAGVMRVSCNNPLEPPAGPGTAAAAGLGGAGAAAGALFILVALGGGGGGDDGTTPVTTTTTTTSD